MTLLVDEELKEICLEIVAQQWSEQQWAQSEADDWFQTERFQGGYDATEKAFCFSFHASDSGEYWFQISLAEAESIARGEQPVLTARLAIA